MIQDFFANGMLISVMSAIDLLSVKESWAQSICPGMEKFEAMKAISTLADWQRHDRAGVVMTPIFFFLRKIVTTHN